MNDNKQSLNELLHLSYPNQFEWLLNKPGAEIQVNWVVTCVDDLKHGDILLLPGNKLSPNILNGIVERGCSGLILVGETFPDDLIAPESLPIVSLPGKKSLRKIQQKLLEIMINQRAFLVERSVRIHVQLSKLIAEGQGLYGLTKVMSELAGCGVVVQDKRLMILAEYPAPNLLSFWDDVLAHLGDKSNLPSEFGNRKKLGKLPIILKQSIYDQLERIVTPIVVGGISRGYLSLIDFFPNLDALDHLVAEQGALVCSIEMSRAKAVREAEKRLKGDLLSALLQENITPRDANLWIQNMGLDLGKEHVAIRFAWDAASTPSMRRLETLVNGEITRRGCKVLVEELGSEIVCICQVEASSGRPIAAVSLAEGVSVLAEQEFPEVPIRSGIGQPAGDLIYWRDSFRQAGQALEMSRRLSERKPLYFPDLMVYRLLLQLEHHPDLHTFKSQILGALLSYEGGGDLIRTLEVFFEHNGVLSQAAEALFIHRNTLIYRMERIAEITGLDLDNTETRLAIQLALRIHRMWAGKRD